MTLCVVYQNARRRWPLGKRACLTLSAFQPIIVGRSNYGNNKHTKN